MFSLGLSGYASDKNPLKLIQAKRQVMGSHDPDAGRTDHGQLQFIT